MLSTAVVALFTQNHLPSVRTAAKIAKGPVLALKQFLEDGRKKNMMVSLSQWRDLNLILLEISSLLQVRFSWYISDLVLNILR